jgi:peptidoglycan LD-endopeptidase LytH
VLTGFILLGAGCVTTVQQPDPVVAPVSAEHHGEASKLTAQIRQDLAVLIERDRARGRTSDAQDAAEAERRIGVVLGALQMPVAGVRPYDLSDNFGAPRDGGKRTHRGIDIFAPRGTEVLAVADGVITFIGEQPLGGRCIWLRAWDGTAFYYAHLDRWAPGLREGMRVRRGEPIGYVGNTGNAIRTPPHLHFQIVLRDEVLNPYPHLLKSTTGHAAPVLGGGFGR